MKSFERMNQQSLFNKQDNEIRDVPARLSQIQSLGQTAEDWSQWMFRRLQKKPGCRVLEWSCGCGGVWQQNLRQIPLDWAVTLFDCSARRLQETQMRLGHCNRHFTFYVFNERGFPCEDACFDLLIATFLLSQVTDRARAFAEIRRVLHADGIFYAATLSENAFASLNLLLEEAGLPLWANTAAFSVENGADQLARWFTDVTLHRLTHTLAVREAEPLLRCLRSGIPHDQDDEEAFQRLEKRIRQELSRNGEIALTLDIGLFEASNRVT